MWQKVHGRIGRCLDCVHDKDHQDGDHPEFCQRISMGMKNVDFCTSMAMISDSSASYELDQLIGNRIEHNV